jgi:putative GTP pyrophosphokinase
MANALTAADRSFIRKSVARYITNKDIFEALGEALFTTITQSASLAPLIHSVKYRLKSSDNLAEKLRRKIKERGRDKWGITEENLFQKVNDLVGLRILHLHTSQIEAIDVELRKCLSSEKYKKIEGPIAKTWDIEYKKYFSSIGIRTEESPRQYTSVHYVFSAKNDLKLTFEIQVRTLAEELWGEVDHQLNYPDPHPAIACKEQIAVLARVTSSCTRLVDSIIRSKNEYDQSLKKLKAKRKRPQVST